MRRGRLLLRPAYSVNATEPTAPATAATRAVLCKRSLIASLHTDYAERDAGQESAHELPHDRDRCVVPVRGTFSGDSQQRVGDSGGIGPRTRHPPLPVTATGSGGTER